MSFFLLLCGWSSIWKVSLLRLSSLCQHAVGVGTLHWWYACRGSQSFHAQCRAGSGKYFYSVIFSFCALQPRVLARPFFPTTHHRIYEQGYGCHRAQRGVRAAESDLGYFAHMHRFFPDLAIECILPPWRATCMRDSTWVVVTVLGVIVELWQEGSSPGEDATRVRVMWWVSVVTLCR